MSWNEIKYVLLIYSTYKTSRLDYVFDQVLRGFLGLEWRLTQNVEEFTAQAGPKFNYSDSRLEKEIWLQPYGLLNQSGLGEPQPDCFLWKGLPVFFKVDGSAVLIGIWHNSYISDKPVRMRFFKDVAEKLKPKN